MEISIIQYILRIFTTSIDISQWMLCIHANVMMQIWRYTCSIFSHILLQDVEYLLFFQHPICYIFKPYLSPWWRYPVIHNIYNSFSGWSFDGFICSSQCSLHFKFPFPLFSLYALWISAATFLFLIQLSFCSHFR